MLVSLLLALASPVLANIPWSAPSALPANGPTAGGAPRPGGDSPLEPLARFAGRFDVHVDVIPFDGTPVTSGAFRVSGVPEGALVEAAWLLVTSFDTFAENTVSATFAGAHLDSRRADVIDPSLSRFCALYRFDVTPYVSGNGDYPYAATGQGNAFGDALVVVYGHPSLPLRTIAINDGAEGLAFATTTTSFAALPEGACEVTLFVEADNPSMAEEVRLNGSIIASGDIFAANLGPAASLVTLPAVTSGGSNTLEVVTTDDWFGLHLAVLRIDAVSDRQLRSVSLEPL